MLPPNDKIENCAEGVQLVDVLGVGGIVVDPPLDEGGGVGGVGEAGSCEQVAQVVAGADALRGCSTPPVA